MLLISWKRLLLALAAVTAIQILFYLISIAVYGVDETQALSNANGFRLAVLGSFISGVVSQSITDKSVGHNDH